MFVQVIQGRVRDEAVLRQQVDRWRAELAPGAEGWLGTTAGVAPDGEFVAVVRFESEEAARANSDRPEQSEWWNETAGSLEDGVTFVDCREVDLIRGGGSDDAGFVQIIQGTGDQQELRKRASDLEDVLARLRPDVIGGLVAWHGDGRFTQAVYFTSEAEAREAETQEVSPEDAAARERAMSLMQDVRFVDLREPWLHST